MILAYYSRTGNTADFLDWYFPEYERRSIEVWNADAPFVLFTPTYDFGEVPEEVRIWLSESNDSYMEAVVAGGNRNFASLFGESGDKIEAKYGVPLLMKYELKGNPQVAELVKERMSELLPK